MIRLVVRIPLERLIGRIGRVEELEDPLLARRVALLFLLELLQLELGIGGSLLWHPGRMPATAGRR